jgi:DNA-binding SARP family transcriptional activator/tetratricopeptide (TPR) repeat protein
LQVRLLGPVDVVVDGVPRPVSGLRRKAVLAVLALHPGQVVSADRLIDVVWDGEAPATASNTLQSHVSQLRRILGSRTAILARPPGYLLDVSGGDLSRDGLSGSESSGSGLSGEATDLQVAERLIGQAERAADPAECARHLRSALALWRGPSMLDVTGPLWLDEQADRLERIRLAAIESLTEARLALGEHAQLIPDLERLTQQHPYHENLQRQLILALYRSGRQADALATYQRLRSTLRGNLGVDPNQVLRDLEAGILRQDTALDLPAPATAENTIPAQLPSVVTAFAGRSGELAALDALVAGADEADPTRPTAVVISAVSGTAGVGKTALAVHWAHRVAPRFPDGQLYVNLRGFDPDGSVVDPATAVRGFLDALGVPAEGVPTGLGAQTALYRSLLAGKRVLVVLDNARDVEQVRPLLPGSPGCLVIVTSRNQLGALVTAEGAYPLTLGLLSTAHARDLLSLRLGANRVATEPDAVAEIVTRCTGLPLALAIVAGRAATHPRFPLAALAGELREAADGLDAFSGGDPATDLRTVFSWSYRALSTGAATLFRLLGPAPGADITVPAAASLAAAPAGQVRALLAELTRMHLVVEHAPGRYTMHDLLRVYATEQARTQDSEDDQEQALHRLLDHYLHSAQAVAGLLNGRWDRLEIPPAAAGVTPEEFATERQAVAWFTTERPVLLAAIEQAARRGFGTHAWRLAWTLTNFLEQRGHWHEWAVAQTAALDAAQRADDPIGRARAHHGLGRALSSMGSYPEATSHLTHALGGYQAQGDRVAEAHVYLNLGFVYDRQGRDLEALGHTQRALDLFRLADHEHGQAVALNNLGWSHAQLGDHEHALVYCRQGLDLCRQCGDRNGEANAWDSLGYAHHQLGRYERAAICYRQALDLYRELGDRYDEASTLSRLSDTHQALGDQHRARDTWCQAVSILDRLGHPDADRMRESGKPYLDAEKLVTSSTPVDRACRTN